MFNTTLTNSFQNGLDYLQSLDATSLFASAKETVFSAKESILNADYAGQAQAIAAEATARFNAAKEAAATTYASVLAQIPSSVFEKAAELKETVTRFWSVATSEQNLPATLTLSALTATLALLIATDESPKKAPTVQPMRYVPVRPHYHHVRRFHI